MLSEWLSFNFDVKTEFTKFKLIETDEKVNISEGIQEYLKDLILTARFSPKMIAAIKRYGWKKVENNILQGGLPKKRRKQGGDFGEALVSATLKEIMGYTIPVPKLQFTVSSEQSMPGTDTIGIKMKGENISEICFVESKLRNKGDTYSCKAGVEGFRQLKEDYSDNVPGMINFILARLCDKDDPLFDSFMRYLNDRQQLTSIERFHLGLIWDQKCWKQSILELLEDEIVPQGIPRVIVQRIKITDLAQNIKEIFTSLGVECVD